MRKYVALAALGVAAIVSGVCIGVYTVAWRFGGRLIWSDTGSMPTGYYQMVGTTDHFTVGSIATACPRPLQLATEILVENVNGDGCPHHIGAIIKIVVAVGGDVVNVRNCGIIVNSRLLANSRPVPHAMRDQTVANHIQRLQEGEAMLWSPHPKSDDSRYWGAYHPFAVSSPVATLPYHFNIHPRFLDPRTTSMLCRT